MVIGRRGSGKTLSCSTSPQLQGPKAKSVFSATDHMQHAYSKHFNSKFIFKTPDDATLQKVIDAQKDLVAKNNSFEASGLLVIIDDAGHQGTAIKDHMSELLMNGRCYRCAVIVGVQDASSIPLALRTQFTDLICARTEPFKVGREQLYKWFFGQYGSTKDFQKHTHNSQRITAS